MQVTTQIKIVESFGETFKVEYNVKPKTILVYHFKQKSFGKGWELIYSGSPESFNELSNLIKGLSNE